MLQASTDELDHSNNNGNFETKSFLDYKPSKVCWFYGNGYLVRLYHKRESNDQIGHKKGILDRITQTIRSIQLLGFRRELNNVLTTFDKKMHQTLT